MYAYGQNILNLRGVSFVLFDVSLQKGPCTENEQ